MRNITACFAAVLTSFATLHAAEAPKPLKVFILAGQSNREGQGFIAADAKCNDGKGSLEFLVKNPATAERFKHLRNMETRARSFSCPHFPAGSAFPVTFHDRGHAC